MLYLLFKKIKDFNRQVAYKKAHSNPKKSKKAEDLAKEIAKKESAPKVDSTLDHFAVNPDGAMDLDNNYDMTVAELGLQQSKRDQIIAFYLTILGFVIPSVISLEIHNGAKAVAFLAMYGIGVIFCHVIIRYRTYKEVYWIACRVLTQLCNIHKPFINEQTIYTLYFNALVKNMGSIVVKNKRKKKDAETGAVKTSILRSFIKQLDSAETLLFETLALFSTFVGGIGAFYAYSIHWSLTVVIFIILIEILVSLNYRYVTKLLELYKVVDTQAISDLQIPFKKAWMLHCYVDDLTSSNKNATLK